MLNEYSVVFHGINTINNKYNFLFIPRNKKQKMNAECSVEVFLDKPNDVFKSVNISNIQDFYFAELTETEFNKYNNFINKLFLKARK